MKHFLNSAVENNAPVEIIRNEDYQNRNEDPANQAQEEENRKSEDDESDDDDDIELTFASREALFDPNSKQDLLEDFEIPPSPISEASQLLIDQRVEENMHGPFDVVLLGVSMHASEGIFKSIMFPKRQNIKACTGRFRTQFMVEESQTHRKKHTFFHPKYYILPDNCFDHPSYCYCTTFENGQLIETIVGEHIVF